MKIITLSLDNKVLNKNSASWRRQQEYASLVEKYVVLVPTREKLKIEDNNLVVWGSGGITRLARLVRLGRLAEKILKKEKFDLISVQDIYFLAALAVKLRSRFKIGVEIQVHGIEKMNWWRRGLAEKNLQQADSVRIVGGHLRQLLTDKFGVEDKNITEVPIFFDWQAWQHKPFASDFGKRWQGNFVFLVVGRLVPVKQIDEIIRALAQVVEIEPKVKLIIIGEGPMAGKLASLVHELGLDKQVEFVSWQSEEELVNYYRAADCLVQASEQEGYGLALLEALACQLPVITTPVGVARQVVKDGENGLVVKDNDDLVRMMKLVVVNREMLNKFKNNTRKYLSLLPSKDEVLSKYYQSWERAAVSFQAKD